MLARRFLLGGGGSAVVLSPAPVPDLAATPLTSAPEGGWTWFNDPRAISYNGYTYVGYMKGVSGDVAVRAIEESTLTVAAEKTLHAALEIDDHDNPGLYVRPSDHRLICFYSPHVGASYYKRVSTNSLDSDPTLSGGFAAEVDLDSSFGESHYTYANPVGLSEADGVEGDTIWVFHRRHVSDIPRWCYHVSDDGGATWGGGIHLHALTYSRVVSDGVGRIDVVAANHPFHDTPNNTKVRHIYREAAAWHQSDGTDIAGPAPVPTDDMTTVYDSGGDPVWIWDIAYGLDGHPRIAFSVYPSDTDHRYWYARWTGSAWVASEIVAGGTHIPTEAVGANPIESYYSGGVCLDHEDPSVVYCSVGVGSDLWQMRRYVTADGGTTWAGSTLTSGGKHVRPVSVWGHGDDIQALWMTGPYDSYANYSVGTTGAGVG